MFYNFNNRYFLIQSSYKNFIKNYEIIDLYSLKLIIKTEQNKINFINPLSLLSSISIFFINYPINKKIDFYSFENNHLFNIHFKYINEIYINKIFRIEDKIDKSLSKEIEKTIFKIKLPPFYSILKNIPFNFKIEITKENDTKFILTQEKIVNYILYKDKEDQENIICTYYKTNDINKIIELFYSIQELRDRYKKDDILKNILINKVYFLLTLSSDISSLIEFYSDDVIYLIFGLPVIIDIIT
ncbi:MAG: hypothetical protein N2485_05620 [bacterium]|nr:hypothetical protein [bacterium]